MTHRNIAVLAAPEHPHHGHHTWIINTVQLAIHATIVAQLAHHYRNIVRAKMKKIPPKVRRKK